MSGPDVLTISSESDDSPVVVRPRRAVSTTVKPRVFCISSEESSGSSDSDCLLVGSSGDEATTAGRRRRLSLPKLSHQTPKERSARSNARLLKDVSNLCLTPRPTGFVPSEESGYRQAMDLFKSVLDSTKLTKPAPKPREFHSKMRRPCDSKILYRRSDYSDSDSEPSPTALESPPPAPPPLPIKQTLKENRTPASQVKKKSKKGGLSCLSDLQAALADIELPSKSKLSFLASLDDLADESVCHPMALPYRRAFGRNKMELTATLFAMFNQSVFDGQLPEAMAVDWNGRLTSSAGITHLSRKILDGEMRYLARIALSKALVTTAARLRDTLIHEMCHAAVWLVDKSKGGHGPVWKAWTYKAREAHPELRPINVCHSYSRDWKFLWQCVSCGYTIGRMTKSFDTARYTCGGCRGQFKLKEKEGQKKREANGFAKFVKQNYASVKAESGGNHKEVMAALSEIYKREKLASEQQIEPAQEIDDVDDIST